MRVESEFTIIVCATCGVLYGMPEALRVDSGGAKFCPNGHTPVCRTSAADRIAAAEEATRLMRRRAETAERSNAALRGAIVRLKARPK